ncbi:MAG: ATP-binding protein [Nanoarchaeota archaeon]
MLLGRVSGRITTNDFSFKLEGDARKFDYVQVHHPAFGNILSQIIEIERNDDELMAKCLVIGYKDEAGKIKAIGSPIESNSEILLAEDQFIREVTKIEDPKTGAYIGKLEGKDIRINLDINKLLTKHIAVLAKSGSGKSYTVGVLLEEIAEKKIPLLVIDPHGEYSSMAEENKSKDEVKFMAAFGIKPKKYAVQEFGDAKVNPNVRPLILPNDFTSQELLELLPGKINANQMGVLYNALKDLERITFPNILLRLEQEESNAKWNIINIISYLHSLGIFSDSGIPYSQYLKSGTISIINLRGINPDIQELIVYKLCKDLFELRKKNRLPPFFLVIEEAHNFCPERSFGEAKSSKILRNIASEGRKFGLGLCVITQRPARIDKSVLSQCTTQIILKVTNPNDLKAISGSVEGLTGDVEKEIQNLAVGTAIITGITDIPLFVSVRPRKSLHGGKGIEVIRRKDEESFLEKVKEFRKEELLPVIISNISANDLKIVSDPAAEIRTLLVPAVLFVCEENRIKFNILVELEQGKLITNIDTFESKKLPDLSGLGKSELVLLQRAFQEKAFSLEDLQSKVKLNAPLPESFQKLRQRGLIRERARESGVRENSIVYEISDEHVFSKLMAFQTYAKVEYVKVDFDEKKAATVGVMEARNLLSSFTKIVDEAECFVVRNTVVSH